MPAEWEPHEAVWLAWPYDADSFPYLEEAEKEIGEFIKEIHADEKIELLVLDEEIKQRASQVLREKNVDFSRVNFYVVDYLNAWMRDCAPIFVSDGEKGNGLAMVRWLFNAWGNKYPEMLKDAKIPDYMKSVLKLPMLVPGIVMEGGSIEVNGQGTVLTTESCLLNKNRNPNLSKPEIEKYLSDYLGAQKVIWLKQGIEGDDTDGHIDDIARFVNANTALCAYSEDETDADFAVLKENYEILLKSTDQDGNRFKVVKLPTPGWVGEGKRRLPASYANFYISNQKVIVPIFGKENDERALGIIREAFPNRKVVGLHAFYLVFGLGTFHCMTQQQPAA